MKVHIYQERGYMWCGRNTPILKSVNYYDRERATCQQCIARFNRAFPLGL